jgi:hypothetical protein
VVVRDPTRDRHAPERFVSFSKFRNEQSGLGRVICATCGNKDRLNESLSRFTECPYSEPGCEQKKQNGSCQPSTKPASCFRTRSSQGLRLTSVVLEVLVGRLLLTFADAPDDTIAHSLLGLVSVFLWQRIQCIDIEENALCVWPTFLHTWRCPPIALAGWIDQYGGCLSPLEPPIQFPINPVFALKARPCSRRADEQQSSGSFECRSVNLSPVVYGGSSLIPVHTKLGTCR